MKRRTFIRASGLTAVSTAVPYGIYSMKSETSSKGQALSDPEPTPEQKAWMQLGFGMFIHFGINTYYDREWSDGDLDPIKFNPEELDTDQWCSVAKKAGMKYLVLVCKHHDGFCLWPSKYTDYGVKSSPFKSDVVGEVVKSARKYDLKVGFYYSLWDSHQKIHDTDEAAYVKLMKNHLSELLTNYGEVIELWFDGFWKKQQSGWSDADGNHTSPEEFVKAWRFEGAYRWQIDHLYQFVKELQPGCLIMNNATTRYPGVPLHPVDILSGERASDDSKEIKHVWSWLGKDHFYPMQIETTMSTKGNKKFPRGNWFWHEWDHSVASKEQIMSWLEVAGKRNANLLLNCGPMANGKLRPEDVEVLSTL